MVMNVPNVELYLSNNYQTNDNYNFSEAKVFFINNLLVIDFLMLLYI